MARDNYFRLLKISFDPVEHNNAVIQAAIEKQLQFWRESIKKGINKAKFQEYLSLEDDMRKIMLDYNGREKEARIAEFIRDEEEYTEKNKDKLKEYSEKLATINVQEILKKLSLTESSNIDSVYDFLNIKITSSDKNLDFNTKTSCNLLMKRAKDLCEIYRNLNNNVDNQKLSGYCSDIFTNEESKKNYDDYIIFEVKRNIIKRVDHTYELNNKKIPYDEYTKIVQISAKSYFTINDVKKFIQLYCERNEYIVELYVKKNKNQQDFSSTQRQNTAEQTEKKQNNEELLKNEYQKSEYDQRETYKKEAQKSEYTRKNKNYDIEFEDYYEPTPFYVKTWFVWLLIILAISFGIALWFQCIVLTVLIFIRYKKAAEWMKSIIVYVILLLLVVLGEIIDYESTNDTAATISRTEATVASVEKTRPTEDRIKPTENMTSDETETNIVRSDNYYIDSIKTVALLSYPDVYIGEALGILFEDNSWSVEINESIVNVYYRGRESKIYEEYDMLVRYDENLSLEFIIYTNNGDIYLNGGTFYLSINNEPLEDNIYPINSIKEFEELIVQLSDM